MWDYTAVCVPGFNIGTFSNTNFCIQTPCFMTLTLLYLIYNKIISLNAWGIEKYWCVSLVQITRQIKKMFFHTLLLLVCHAATFNLKFSLSIPAQHDILLNNQYLKWASKIRIWYIGTHINCGFFLWRHQQNNNGYLN